MLGELDKPSNDNDSKTCYDFVMEGYVSVMEKREIIRKCVLQGSCGSMI